MLTLITVAFLNSHIEPRIELEPFRQTRRPRGGAACLVKPCPLGIVSGCANRAAGVDTDFKPR
jgi:hypothetical protein